MQDCIICGGAQGINKFAIGSFDALSAFSVNESDPTKASRPFDKGRDGLIPSGGAATVVLESLESAQKRGATILGEVTGYGFSSNGAHISNPTVEGPVGSLAMALKDDMSHIFKINEAFSNNELVCMPADRFLDDNKTVTLNFLGADAKFPLGPFMLATRFKVPVTIVFGMKESAFHYHFFSTPIKEYLNLDREANLHEILHDFIESVELKVKQYPEQWYNYYNFWK